MLGFGLSLLPTSAGLVVVKSTRKFKQLCVMLLALPILLGALVFFVGGRGRDLTAADQLVVFSYSSFISPWGPGPELAQKFFEREGIQVKFVDSGDSALIVERLRFQSPKDRVDLVLGLDQLVVPEARRVLKWKPISFPEPAWDKLLPESIHHEGFIPFDWGPLTFIESGAKKSVHTLQDFLDPQLQSQIILLDPRTSTPGFQFLYWLVSTLGEEEAFRFLEKLRPSVHSVHSSWSTGYNLFQRGEADFIFTYMTSAVYHWVEEKNKTIRPVPLDTPLPYQVEYVGIPEKCVRCAEAQKFIEFLLEPDSQYVIMAKNYMLPVVDEVRQRAEEFNLGSFELMTGDLDQNLLGRKRQLLERWKTLGL